VEKSTLALLEEFKISNIFNLIINRGLNMCEKYPNNRIYKYSFPSNYTISQSHIENSILKSGRAPHGSCPDLFSSGGHDRNMPHSSSWLSWRVF